jgi:hypothetical protein
MRQAAEMGKHSQGRLRNVMASMGAAESSQFLDRYQGVDRDVQTRIADFTRDMQSKIGEIDRILQERRDLTDKERRSLEQQRDDLIKEAESSIDMYGIQEQNELNNIFSQEAQGQLDFQSRMRDFALQSLMQRQQQAAELQNLALQGNIDQSYLQQQLGGMDNYAPNIPPEIRTILDKPGNRLIGGGLSAMGRSELSAWYNGLPIEKRRELKDLVLQLFE